MNVRGARRMASMVVRGATLPAAPGFGPASLGPLGAPPLAPRRSTADRPPGEPVHRAPGTTPCAAEPFRIRMPQPNFGVGPACCPRPRPRPRMRSVEQASPWRGMSTRSGGPATLSGPASPSPSTERVLLDRPGRRGVRGVRGPARSVVLSGARLARGRRLDVEVPRPPACSARPHLDTVLRPVGLHGSGVGTHLGRRGAPRQVGEVGQLSVVRAGIVGPLPPRFDVAELRERFEAQAQAMLDDVGTRLELATGADPSSLKPASPVWMPDCDMHDGVYDGPAPTPNSCLPTGRGLGSAQASVGPGAPRWRQEVPGERRWTHPREGIWAGRAPEGR